MCTHTLAHTHARTLTHACTHTRTHRTHTRTHTDTHTHTHTRKHTHTAPGRPLPWHWRWWWSCPGSSTAPPSSAWAPRWEARNPEEHGGEGLSRLQQPSRRPQQQTPPCLGCDVYMSSLLCKRKRRAHPHIMWHAGKLPARVERMINHAACCWARCW